MITVKQLASEFENGLNAVLNNKEIQFKIWATAGEYRKPVRDGNVIVHEIVGNLRTSASSNDANNVLTMGVNGLTLDFMLPIYPPHINAKQTEAELAKIKDGQYPFVEYLLNAINAYFQDAQVTEMTDENNVEFSVAFQAGTVLPGSVEMSSKYGNAIPISIVVQVYFIEGGTNSQDIKITVDGKLMPFQAVRLGRAAVLERDVFAGETVSKCLTSSTAFTVDADFPSSNNPATTTALSYLLDGEANTAHFVNVQWGKIAEKLFLMSYNTVQTSATGIAVAGVSASLVELGGSEDLYNLPQGFHTVRFTFTDSQTETLSFTLSEECQTYIAGVGAKVRKGAQTVTLASDSFEINEKEENYIVNLIVDKQVTITNASAPFTFI